MISMKELLPNSIRLEDLEPATQANLRILLAKLNVIRAAYAKPMTVTSGLRSMKHHKQVYADINATRKKQGLPELVVPMGSKHLIGAAADIYDPKGELQQWCLKNVKLLEEQGLYCEDFAHTRNWVHFQHIPPRSLNRFFNP